MFSNRRFGYGSATFGYGGGRISRSFMDGISARTSLLGLWSTARRAWSGYSGAILRARRSSDNAEKDFYPNGPLGEVSTAELRAWNGWNLLGRTENFADASWVRTGLNAISASIETPPIAGLAVFLITEDTSTGGHNVLQNFASFAASTQVTFSVYAKAAGRSVVVLRCAGSERTFTLTGSGSVSGGAGGSIQSLGNGWYRLSNTQTIPDTATRDYTIRLHDGIGTSYTGDGTSGILLGGVQLEAAASATTYETRSGAGAGSSFLVTLYEQAESGRNLLTRTEEFDVSPWNNSISGTGVASTVTANAGMSPIGDSTADRIQFSLGGGTAIGDLSRRVQSTSSGAGTFVYSVYLRSFDGVSTYNMHLVDPNSQTRNIVVTGSWQRFEVSATTAVNATSGLGLRGAQSPAHPNTADVLVWGAQLEVGTTATAYERRTTHGAGTRLNFTQSTTTLQPIICEQGVPVTENGRLAAKFVTADARRMSVPSSTAMFNALHTTGGTVLCVSRANDTAVSKTIVSSTTSSTGAGFRFTRGSNENTAFLAGRLDVAGVATAGNSISLSSSVTGVVSLQINSFIVDPDNGTAASRISYWENGVQGASANGQTGTPFVENASDNLSIGATASGGTPHDGTISEIALFSNLIGDSDRVTLEDRAGDFYVVAVTQPITITTQPTSKLVTFGEAFTLTCEGTNVQTYNWQFRNAGDTAWSAVGVQTSTLNLVGEAAMNGREYRCVLINPNASATSNTATITAQGIMAKVGTFNSPTATGSQAVTGVGFQPKLILQKSTLISGSGITTGAMFNVGAATATSQASVAATSRSGVTTSETERRHLNSSFIGHEAWSGGITGVTASLTSLDADGFTSNWTAVSAGSWTLNYTALSGSALEASLVQCQMNNTNAAQSFSHGLSGAPTGILFFSSIQSSAPPLTETTLLASIGAWANGSQFSSAIRATNAATTTNTRRMLSTSASVIHLGTSGALRTLSVSSVDATNVNVTYPVTDATTASFFWMLCLRGCQAQVGTFDLNGSLDPLSISCPGITPRLFLPVLSPNSVDSLESILTSAAFLTIGASDGVNTVSCGISDQNGLTTTNTRRFQSSSDIEEYNSSGTRLIEALVSFSGQSVVIDASSNDSNVGQGGYLIIGE